MKTLFSLLVISLKSSLRRSVSDCGNPGTTRLCVHIPGWPRYTSFARHDGVFVLNKVEVL